MSDVQAEIAAVLEQFQQAWNRMDFDSLRALWDRTDMEPYYLPEEVSQPLRDHAAIDDYFAHTQRSVEWVRVELADVRVKPLSDALVVATFAMHVDAAMRGYDVQGFAPVGLDTQVTTILRSGEAGWRFIHYAEAALGALPFLRRVYNANVRSTAGDR
ncbi:MAG: nuclear transport factor 2 family protein [Xanthomonadales bacterium]|nr:nuclear transport factor 2 family protein [Xanthomonadales bacterium]